jgi:hypothetical protein
VKPAISKDVPTGELQARPAAMADATHGAIIGKTLEEKDHKREPGGGASLRPCSRRNGRQSISRLIHLFRVPQAGETRAGSKIRALKLIE